MKKALPLVIPVLVLLFSFKAWSLVEVPVLNSRVTDLTNSLSESEITILSTQLEALEQTKGSQVAVLMVPSTMPEDISQFSIRVVDSWKLGRRGVDDGLLLIIAKNDRRLRIEVGRGLEGAIPDAIANRIIDEIIKPRFRENRYFEGIQAGINSITKVIEGEPLPAPPVSKASKKDLSAIVLFLLAILGQSLNSNRKSLALAFGAGFITFLGALVFFPVLIAFLFGVVVFSFSIMSFGTAEGVYPGRGGFGSGGSFGGSFGGGGFSGGGGSFGGGGASGSW